MKNSHINQRRTPKQHRAIVKYNEILDTSARVLSVLGYQNTTMNEISLESGHPYSTIYQYFANKEDIYVAWLQRFIDSSLFGLSKVMLERPNANLDSYIEDSVKLTLTETVKHQQTLQELFSNMPVLTKTLVQLMEARALMWLKEAFGYEVNANTSSPLEQSLLTTVRAGNGYWLQIALNTERNIDIEQESKNFAALVKALLVRD